MPIGIDTESKSLVGLGVVSGDRTKALTQQRGTMWATDVKAHVGRVAAIEAMAVDATLELCVLNQRALIKRREVSFVNAHFAPHLVTWLYKTVADAVVDAVRADINREGAKTATHSY